jgi:hypothetical protein
VLRFRKGTRESELALLDHRFPIAFFLQLALKLSLPKQVLTIGSWKLSFKTNYNAFNAVGLVFHLLKFFSDLKDFLMPCYKWFIKILSNSSFDYQIITNITDF